MNSGATEILAVLFDFDGTLGDSYEAIAASVNHVRQHHGLPPLSTDQVKQFVGYGLHYLLKHTVPTGDLEQNARLYRAHHPSVMRQGTKLLPGAKTTLESLKRMGKRVAVCSNKPGQYTKELIQSLGISHLVDTVVCPEDVAEPKPAPDMLLEAVSRLAVPKNQCVYVGDMRLDIEAARKAGLAVWIIPTGSESKEVIDQAKPDRMLETLTEILELVDP